MPIVHREAAPHSHIINHIRGNSKLKSSQRRKIAVLGGGIVGIVSAFLLSDDFDVVVISPELGGTWRAGGLKILKWHPAIVELMSDLKVPVDVASIRGGVWWNDKFVPLESVSEKIQQAHYRKTRGTLEGYTSTCMNAKAGEEAIIKFDFEKFVELAKREMLWATGRIVKVVSEPGGVEVRYALSATITSHNYFDYVINTLPLWVFRKLVTPVMPQVEYQKLFTAEFKAEVNNIHGCEYIYMPQGEGPHRLSVLNPDKNIWTAEAISTERPNWLSFRGDIRCILQGARLVRESDSHQPGHLMPLSAKLKYPARITPAGRFASWDTRETVDKVATKILAFKESLND